jgi:lipopolysaccharide biosynthesis glycosyltransferase
MLSSISILHSIYVLICLLCSCELSQAQQSLQEETIHISVTICGLHHIVFSHGLLGTLLVNPQARRIHLYVVADTLRALSMECYKPRILKYLKNITIINRHDVRHLMTIPPNIHLDGYFRCACDRLFFHELFPDVDRMLYIDTDTLVLEDLQHLWDHFAYMEDKIIGVAHNKNDSLDATPSYESPKTQFLPPHGLNSGVMLYNMKYMRKIGYNATAMMMMNTESTKFADQDILNTYAYFHRSEFYLLPCYWNRGFSSNCDWSNSTNGIMHGYAWKFFNDDQGLFAPERWRHFHNVFEEMTQLYAMYPNGTMLRAFGQRNVYFIDKGKKRLMNSIETVVSLGLDLDQKVELPPLILEAIPEGELLYDRSGVNYLRERGSNVSHPVVDLYICQDKPSDEELVLSSYTKRH